MTKKKTVKKKAVAPLVPSSSLNAISPTQLSLDLFFLDPLLDKNHSNAFQIYDSMGRHHYGKKGKYIRSPKGIVDFDQLTLKRSSQTKINNQIYDIDLTVQAAVIEVTEKGVTSTIMAFPGSREEVVEDFIRKIASNARGEAFVDTSGKTHVGVKFTLYELYQALASHGYTFKYEEIREALDIMKKCNLEFKSNDGKINVSGAIFPVCISISDEENSQYAYFVTFHPMVTELIVSQHFRRYKIIHFDRPYARILYKRLCLRWPQAKPGEDYSVLLSTLVRSTKSGREFNVYEDKKLFEEACIELKEKGIIENYSFENKKEGGVLVDRVLHLLPTEMFTRQQKSNNTVAKKVSIENEDGFLSVAKRDAPSVIPVRKRKSEEKKK